MFWLTEVLLTFDVGEKHKRQIKIAIRPLWKDENALKESRSNPSFLSFRFVKRYWTDPKRLVFLEFRDCFLLNKSNMCQGMSSSHKKGMQVLSREIFFQPRIREVHCTRIKLLKSIYYLVS